MIRMSSAELRQKLLESTSIDDFLTHLKAYRHARQCEVAKEVSESGIYDEVVRKSLVLEVLTRENIFLQGKRFKNMANRRIKDEYHNRSPVLMGTYIDEDEEKLKKPRFLLANAYRDMLTQSTNFVVQNRHILENRLSQITIRLDELYGEFEQHNTEFFQPLSSEAINEFDSLKHKFHLQQSALNEVLLLKEIRELPQKEQLSEEDQTELLDMENFFATRILLVQLRSIYQGQPVKAEVIKNCFPLRDREIMIGTIEEEDRLLKSENHPGYSSEAFALATERSVDLGQEWGSYLEGIAMSVCVKLVEDNILDQEVTTKLGRLVSEKALLEAGDYQKIGELFLVESANREDVVLSLSTNDLHKLIEIYPEIKSKLGRLSPQRDLHTAYKESVLDGYNDRKNFNKKLYGLYKSEIIDEAGRILVEEFLKRRYIGAAKYDRDTSGQKVTEFDISLSEWKALSLLSRNAKSFYEAKAIHELVKSYQRNEEPSEEVFEVIGDVSMYYYSGKFDTKSVPAEKLDLDPQQAILLLEKSPWGYERTQKYLKSIFFRFINDDYRRQHQLSLSERKAWSKAAIAYLNYSDNHPLPINSKDDNKYSKANAHHLAFLARDRKVLAEEIFLISLNERFEPQNSQQNPPEALSLAIREETLIYCIQHGVFRDFADLFSFENMHFNLSDREFSSDISQRMIGYLYRADSQILENIGNKITSDNSVNRENFSFKESLRLLSFFPALDEATIQTYDSKKDKLDPRALVFLGLVRGEIHPVLADKLIALYGDNAVEWTKINFRPSLARNRLMASLVMAGDVSIKDKLYMNWMEALQGFGDPDCKYEYLHPKQNYSRDTASYPWDDYHDTYFENRPIKKEEKVATTEDEYNDITYRRHSFRSIAFTLDELRFDSKDDFRHCFPSDNLFGLGEKIGQYETRGNLEQRVIAEKLFEIQADLIDPSKPFADRLHLLEINCPVKTVVRDVHLERMLRAELRVEGLFIDEQIQRAEQLLSRFKSNEFADSYVGMVIDLRMRKDPSLLFDGDRAVDFIVKYLPKASLKRNHYLGLIEDACSLTIEQAKRINQLKLTEELESHEGEGYYWMSVINHLSSAEDRFEKRKQILWLMKLYTPKPDSVIRNEKREDAVFDRVQDMFLNLTNEEREVIFKRFLLGNQGVVELTQSELYDPVAAKENRKQFLERIGQELIPDTSPNAKLFRRIFTTVFEEAEPVRSTQIVGNLLNKFIEAQKKGDKFSSAEALSVALCSLGVVGKKVAQSLAEQPWVPQDYKEALSKSQENADIIPKTSLMELADQNGLLQEGAPVQIISFNKTIGAASNKQACLVTIVVHDPVIAKKLDVGVGSKVDLVAKFKRPSAQKVENITHDIKLLSGIMQVLKEEGVADQLPQGFEKQIEVAIRRELNFAGEVDFNRKLKADLANRSIYMGYKLVIPEVVFATDDIVIETMAKGFSLRKLLDLQTKVENGVAKLRIPDEAFLTPLRKVKVMVLRELLHELFHSGNIHADLHPANIFVDMVNKRATMIDLGMNVQYDTKRIGGIRHLLWGVASGNNQEVAKALQKLGWDISPEDIKLQSPQIVERFKESIIGRFKTNTNQPLPFKSIMNNNLRALLDLTRFKTPPEDIATLIFAASKMEPYIDAVSGREFIKILTDVGESAFRRR